MTEFEKALTKAKKFVSQITREIHLIQSFLDHGQIPAAYGAAMNLEQYSERLTLLTRTLPAYTGNPAAKYDVEQIMEEEIPVDIGYTAEGWFSVRLPALLPKKESGSPSYIRSCLYPAMQKFFARSPPVRYEDCVLVFRHIYNRERPERQYRDHDNIEVNMATDIVALYVLRDDAPMKCCHYYCTAVGNNDRTEIYVVPKRDFPRWFILEKILPEEGEKLYEIPLFEAKKDM